MIFHAYKTHKSKAYSTYCNPSTWEPEAETAQDCGQVGYGKTLSQKKKNKKWGYSPVKQFLPNKGLSPLTPD